MNLIVNFWLSIVVAFTCVSAFSSEHWDEEQVFDKLRQNYFDVANIDTSEDGLYIVACSARKEQAILNPWMKRLYGTKGEFSHRKTWKGKVTTVDIRSTDISGLSHIKRDLRYFIPDKPVRAIFFELPPAFNDQVDQETSRLSVEKPLEEDNHLLLFPEMLRNMARYMSAGAPLIIEHQPFILYLRADKYFPKKEELLEKNPFLEVMSPYFLDNLYFYHEFIKARTTKSSEDLNSLQLRYMETITKKIRDDFLSLNYSQEIIGKFIALFKKDFAQGTHSIVQTLINKHIIWYDIPPEKLDEMLTHESGRYKKDPKEFLTKVFNGSFSAALALHIGIMEKLPYIVKFLEKNGFEKVGFNMGADNPLNGRKDVWLITAYRNAKPIPE